MSLITRSWPIPALAFVYMLAIFVSVFLGLQPLPYYLILASPVVFLVLISTSVFQFLKCKNIVLYTILYSLPSIGLAYLLSIQTS